MLRHLAEGRVAQLQFKMVLKLSSPQDRGLELRTKEPRSGKRIPSRYAPHLASDIVTTALSRGYLCRRSAAEKARSNMLNYGPLTCLGSRRQTRLPSSFTCGK